VDLQRRIQPAMDPAVAAIIPRQTRPPPDLASAMCAGARVRGPSRATAPPRAPTRTPGQTPGSGPTRYTTSEDATSGSPSAMGSSVGLQTRGPLPEREPSPAPCSPIAAVDCSLGRGACVALRQCRTAHTGRFRGRSSAPRRPFHCFDR
jgi:hypothetical protein